MVISCVSLNSPEYFIGNWKETPLAFSESFQFQEYPYELNEFSFFQVSEGQNLWLRKSENLITTFEIIKKIGLLRFLPKEGYFKANLSNIHWNKPDSVKWSVNDLVQKLFLSYENDSLNEEFFTKFWKRRKMENNDSAVFEILKEINGFYSQGIHPKIGKEKVEGKMFELIKLNVEFLECDSLHKQKHCLKYFDYLRKIGLEHSAYNFIFELLKMLCTNIAFKLFFRY